MSKILKIIALFISLTSWVYAQVKIEKPTVISKNKAFAIFIDIETYKHTRDAVKAYRDIVEKDGLPTYIVSGDFKKPEEVKNEILKLYNAKQSLEGVVFIGEIPIVMIRNAQHMTTAFKMNEDKFPIYESSVPSDRFYDDLNLTFDYIKQDDREPIIHYYKLREDSPQHLNPSIYSARIRYPKGRGGNVYQAISDYLYKVVRTPRDNILDYFVAFTGSAYNSECLVAWKDDVKAYREDFPYLGKTNTHFKHLNFRMDDFMKFKLFDEMQRPEVDLLLMRKHGTPTRELINNEPSGFSIETRIEAIRRELYNNLRKAIKAKKNVDSLKKVYQKKYQLTEKFFDRLNDMELAKQDSAVNANNSIHTADLRKIKTNPLYVILDACYNGSYHEDDYIAGNYIFNEGNTIAAQGNTRNVLQDKWTMNLVGLLSYGVRLGLVHNMNVTLENHLIGDPTFHFGTKENEKLNIQLTKNNNLNYWKSLLKKEDPIYQSVALRKIAEKEKNFSSTLLQYFLTSSYRTVRMQALKLLSKYANADFKEAVKKGLSDEYEMIARQSAIYAGSIGDSDLLEALAEAWVHDKSRQRVQYNIESSLRVFDKSKVETVFIESLQKSNRIDKEKEIADLLLSFRKKGYYELGFEKIMDRNTSLEERIDNIRVIRNYNFHQHVDSYLALLHDSTEPLQVRVCMAEALGWFRFSVMRPLIIESLTKLSQSPSIEKELKDEIIQSLIRLQGYNALVSLSPRA
ncbi:HEAT repeat domain-containing protein [Sphingobacterium thermophilum]|uniref:HEAT repeat domain-containing protein n=1 Tax=Sphingobacterium thermophilum TaxID=768534 RepID=A0ABP8QY03_9SPHI